MVDNTVFRDQILICLASAEDFKANSKFVREELVKQNKEKIKTFLDTVEEVIKQEQNVSREGKFYALFFLKMATEHHNQQLLTQLAVRKQLFKALEAQALFDKDKSFPEKGATFFGANLTDKDRLAGSNYMALLLEVLKYWNQKYSSSDKSKDNIFGVVYRRLAETHKIQFPKNYYFYKSKEQKSNAPGDSNQIGSSQTRPGQERKPQIDLTMKPEHQQINTNSQKKPTILDSKKSETTEVKEAKERISTLKTIFEGLCSLYEFNKVETADLEQTIPFYYEELSNIRKPLEEIIEKFLTKSSQQSEQMLAVLLPLSEKVSGLEENLKKYKGKRVSYLEHRTIALQILAPKEKLITEGFIDDAEKAQMSKSLKVPGVVDEDKIEVGFSDVITTNARKGDVNRNQIIESKKIELDDQTQKIEENKIQLDQKHVEEQEKHEQREDRLKEEPIKIDILDEAQIKERLRKEAQELEERLERERIIKERFRHEGPKLDSNKQTQMIDQIRLQDPSFIETEKRRGPTKRTTIVKFKPRFWQRSWRF